MRAFKSLRDSDGCLRSYLGALGTGVVTSILVEVIQGHSFAEKPSPNPVQAAEIESLVQELKKRIPEPPDWLRGKRITAIGGHNSMFCIASEALSVSSYGAAHVRQALDSVAGFTDEDFAPMAFCQGDLREPAAYIVPKLCLLRAVMEHCEIEEVKYYSAIGSCAGMLISEDLFAAE